MALSLQKWAYAGGEEQQYARGRAGGKKEQKIEIRQVLAVWYISEAAVHSTTGASSKNEHASD